ncbi:Palmitoyltransferase zdhhc14 [Blyttiomyces sp. JEL0837]|nr:Palmitoyltransferase zdhhc14 [Blyttiomyces sp. JEL0837]
MTAQRLNQSLYDTTPTQLSSLNESGPAPPSQHQHQIPLQPPDSESSQRPITRKSRTTKTSSAASIANLFSSASSVATANTLTMNEPVTKQSGLAITIGKTLRPNPPNIRNDRQRLAKEMKMPLCVLSNNSFFSSTSFEPKLFNGWYRRDGFQRPVHGRLHARNVGDMDSCGVGVLWLGFLLHRASTNPQDPKVKRAGVPRNIDYVKSLGVPVIDPDTLFCEICQPCNKCVARFDHHCPYLSTCVGKSNYWTFFTTIALSGLLTLAYSAAAFWACSRYVYDRDDFEAKTSQLLQLNSDNLKVVAGLTLAFAILTLGLSVSIWSLITFHFRLVILRMTTAELLEAQDGYSPAAIAGVETSACRKMYRAVLAACYYVASEVSSPTFPRHTNVKKQAAQSPISQAYADYHDHSESVPVSDQAHHRSETGGGGISYSDFAIST